MENNGISSAPAEQNIEVSEDIWCRAQSRERRDKQKYQNYHKHDIDSEYEKQNNLYQKKQDKYNYKKSGLVMLLVIWLTIRHI